MKRVCGCWMLVWSLIGLCALGCSNTKGGGTVPGGDTGSVDAFNPPTPDGGGTDLPGNQDTVSDDAGPAPEVWSGTAKILVDPTEYTFSYVSPLTQVLTRQITIYNSGTASAAVTGVELLPGGSADFSIIAVPPMPMTLLPGKHTLTIVRFQEFEGGTATLRITTTDPEHQLIDVPLASYLKLKAPTPEPCVAIVPSALNFGTVVRGTTKTLQAELKNCGATDSLTLHKITRSSFFFMPLSEEFQIDPMPPTPTVLGPGQTLPLSIRYAPLLAGPDFGHFLFHTDDPNEPEAKLDVNGVGVAPPMEELGLTIKLFWDADNSDVDSHLIMPGGTYFDCDSDCHFGNPAPDWGVQGDWLDDPFLDVDDVDGYGPEHINISTPMAGTYKYVVHYYDDTYEDSAATDTNATVEVYEFGQLLGTYGPVYLDVTNRSWDVFTIQYPGAIITPLGATYMTQSGQLSICLPFFP